MSPVVSGGVGSEAGSRRPGSVLALGSEWISIGNALGTWPSHLVATLRLSSGAAPLLPMSPALPGSLEGREGLCPFLLPAESWSPGPDLWFEPVT